MNFDRVAGFYDQLAKFVFGGEWQEVQTIAAERLNAFDHVLILGGGTGVILERLNHPQITYVEMSGKMIGQAEKRFTKAEVSFVKTDFLEWKTDLQFDAIYCPFFLDCFDELTLNEVLTKISDLLKNKGQLHVIDFQRGNRIQVVINSIMVLFFRLAVGLRSDKLLPIERIVKNHGFDLVDSNNLMSGWVFTNQYEIN